MEQKLKELNMLDENEFLKAEKEQLKQIDSKEAHKRQKELAKERSLMFYQELKNKRVARIKSKLYHKIKNKVLISATILIPITVPRIEGEKTPGEAHEHLTRYRSIIQVERSRRPRATKGTGEISYSPFEDSPLLFWHFFSLERRPLDHQVGTCLL